MKASYWEIPRIWPDETVFILGGGPSLNDVDFDLIKGKRVIAVNQAIELGSWIDVCWFGDKEWGKTNRKLLNAFGGLKVTCSSEANENEKIQDTKYVARSKSYGIEYQRRTHVAWNGNSGMSAINLAYWLGAKIVVLLGFDMQIKEIDGKKKTHWHDKYAPKVDKKKQIVDPYPRFMKGWPTIKEDSERVGLEIINATPESKIDLFEFQPLEQICI